MFKGYWGWSQGLPRSAMMLSKNPHQQWRESHKAHQIWQISDFLYYREKGRETERETRVLPLEETRTQSHFSKNRFLKTKQNKNVFNFSSSRVLCISDYPHTRWASLVAQMVKNLPEIQETRVWSLDWEDPLEEEMATRSSVLAWRVPRTEASAGYSPWGCKESDTTEWLSRSRRH